MVFYRIVRGTRPDSWYAYQIHETAAAAGASVVGGRVAGHADATHHDVQSGAGPEKDVTAQQGAVAAVGLWRLSAAALRTSCCNEVNPAPWLSRRPRCN